MNYLFLSIAFNCILSVFGTSPLNCVVDPQLVQNIKADIEALNYTVTTAFIGSQKTGNNTGLAPNTGGRYATYIIGPGIDDPVLNPTGGNRTIYRMDASSAIVYHGCSPPQAQYFGIRTYIYNNSDTWIWGAAGDVLNNRVIKTYQTTSTAPFDDVMTIIHTADQDTYNDIIETYSQYDIDESMINLDNIPSQYLTMGLQQNASVLQTLLRVSIPENDENFNYFFDHLNYPTVSNLFLITKNEDNNPIQPINPIPIPDRRDRVCDNESFSYRNEYDLEPKYNELLDDTIEMMDTSYDYELKRTIKIYGNEYNGTDCIKSGNLCGGNSPDALYYEDYNGDVFFMKSGSDNLLNMDISGHLLTDDNLYIIMGVNHYNLGLSAYNQETVYNETFDALQNPDATLNNWQYDGSANYFGDYSQFYSIMYARPGNCVQELEENGVKCVEIDESDLAYDVGFIVFSRVYLNPCTNTGPSKKQFLYEYLLEFEVESTSAPDDSDSSESSESSSSSSSSSNDDVEKIEKEYGTESLEHNHNNGRFPIEIVMVSCIGGVALLIAVVVVVCLKCNPACKAKNRKYRSVDRIEDENKIETVTCETL